MFLIAFSYYCIYIFKLIYLQHQYNNVIICKIFIWYSNFPVASSKFEMNSGI